MMFHPSSLRHRPSPAEDASSYKTMFYSNVFSDIDICCECFEKISSHLRDHLQLTPIQSWFQRSHNDKKVTIVNCDICHKKFSVDQQNETTHNKATMAILLRDSELSVADIAKATSSFPWYGTKSRLFDVLSNGGYDIETAAQLSEAMLK